MKIPGPHLHTVFVGFSFRTFHVMGTLGFFAGTALGIFLTVHQNLPLWVLVVMSLVGAIQLFAHSMVQKLLTGRESLVYYRHEIGIMLLCGGVLWLIGQPVTAFLDISLLGVGVFLAFGRIGCFHTGCCYGMPCAYGVAYDTIHVKDGFPRYLWRVKVFPIQLVEAFLVGLTVLVGTLSILYGARPGTTLVWYTVFYGGSRFVLEFFRGDPERPYWQGFSEAQWTTLALMIATLWMGYAGLLPQYAWHTIATLLLVTSMVSVAFYRRFFDKNRHWLLMVPKHIRELGYGLQNTGNRKFLMQNGYIPSQIPVVQTSFGLRISIGETEQKTHYTLSSTGTARNQITVDKHTSRKIARLIQLLNHGQTQFQLQQGQKNSVFHILFSETPPPSATP